METIILVLTCVGLILKVLWYYHKLRDSKDKKDDGDVPKKNDFFEIKFTYKRGSK